LTHRKHRAPSVVRMTIQQLRATPWRLVEAGRWMAAWHVTSQQQARRNALLASRALTQGRRELLDVEEFLAEHAARRGPVAVPDQRVATRSA
jgi:hypothetical protein